MSMSESILYTNGFFIDTKTQALLTRKFLLADPSWACETDLAVINDPLFMEKVKTRSLPEGFVDACYLQEELSAKGIACSYHSSFTGWVETLDELGDTGLIGRPLRFFINDDELLYIPLENEPTLLNTAYENTAAIIQEVKQKLRTVLSDEFIAIEFICSIRGTIFA